MHRAVLELRLKRARIDCGAREAVDAEHPRADQALATPVHRQKDLARAQRRVEPDPKAQAAPPRAHAREGILGESAAEGVLGVHVEHRLRGMAEELWHTPGAAHAVPLVAQAARGERERKVGPHGLGHGTVRRRHEARAAGGRREVAIGVKARLARGLYGGIGGQRPLERPVALEPRVVDAADVEIAADGCCAVFVERSFGRSEGHECGFATEPPREPLPEIRRNRPVGPRLPRRGHGGAHARDAALRIGDRALLLGPARGRKQEIGVGGGFGVGVGLLHDDELGALERLAHRARIRQRLRGVGADDPDRTNLATAEGLEHRDRRLSWRGREASGGHAPEPLDLGAMGRLGHLAVARQQACEPAHLAPAHRIGLSGQAEGPRSRPPDLPRGQMQVDERDVLVGARARLVEPLAVEREHGRGVPPQGGEFEDLCFRNAADARCPSRRGVAHAFAQRREALGVCVDEIAVERIVPDELMQERVEKRHIRARQDRQVQVGGLGGLGPARIDHDPTLARLLLTRRFEPAKEHRVGPGHVRARDHDEIRVIEVLVAGGRRIGPEGRHVARHRRGHAQPRIRVHVVRADHALRELVEDVIVLGEQLPREIEGHAVRAMAGDRPGEALGGMVERRIPRDARAWQRTCRAQFRVECSPACACDRQMQRAALRAEPPEVRRVRGVPAHGRDAPGLARHDDAAADAAVGAGGAGFGHGGHVRGRGRPRRAPL